DNLSGSLVAGVAAYPRPVCPSYEYMDKRGFFKSRMTFEKATLILCRFRSASFGYQEARETAKQIAKLTEFCDLLKRLKGQIARSAGPRGEATSPGIGISRPTKAGPRSSASGTG